MNVASSLQDLQQQQKQKTVQHTHTQGTQGSTDVRVKATGSAHCMQQLQEATQPETTDGKCLAGRAPEFWLTLP
jgi:hypothetical protein